MAKKPASTSLESDLYQRVARIAKVDRRSVAQVLEQCVESGIAAVEAENADKLREEPTPYGGKQVKLPHSKYQKADKN